MHIDAHEVAAQTWHISNNAHMEGMLLLRVVCHGRGQASGQPVGQGDDIHHEVGQSLLRQGTLLCCPFMADEHFI